MTKPDDADAGSGAIRIGKEERDAAISALDAHLSAGRIDADEYGERAAQIYAARTWGDITPLFTDLPEPRPGPEKPKPRSLSTMVPAEMSGHSRAPARRTDEHDAFSRWGNAVIALSPFVALILFFALDTWLVFLLIPIVAILVKAIGRVED